MMVRQASADTRDTHTAVYQSPVSLQTPAPPPPHQAGYMMPSPGQNMATPAFPAPHTATINQQQQQSFIQQQVWDTICLNVNHQSWMLTSINKCQHVFCPNTHTWGLCIRPHVLHAVFTVFSPSVHEDRKCGMMGHMMSHGGVLCDGTDTSLKFMSCHSCHRCRRVTVHPASTLCLDSRTGPWARCRTAALRVRCPLHPHSRQVTTCMQEL